MYIRKITQTHMGKKYISYRLVASYRNEQGKVRQAMILNLGTGFCIDKNEWKILTERVKQLLLDTPKQLVRIAQSVLIKIYFNYGGFI